MLKKIVLCAVVLCLLLSSVACNVSIKPDESETETDLPLKEKETTEAPTDEPVKLETSEDITEEVLEPTYELVIPAEEQIALFVANRDLWYPVDDYYVPYSYTVCDMDQNGRLELLINVCMGTGFFSENSAWEINETADGVVSCGEIFETYESQIDLGDPQTDVYYDPAGVYYYMTTDYIREGWAFNATSKFALSLEEGQMKSRLLGSCGCEYSEDGTQNITCYDAIGTEISQEEFDNIGQTIFADLKPMTATFYWQAKYMEDTDLLDADGWHRLLEEAWLGFSLAEK